MDLFLPQEEKYSVSRLDAVLPMMIEASKLAVDMQKGNLVINTKEDGTPVTSADEVINKFFIDRLTELFPHDNVIGEEESIIRESDNHPSFSQVFVKNVEHYWIIDPIDGTADYMQGDPKYAIHLACCAGNEVIFGAVAIPWLDRIYIGGRNVQTRRYKQGELTDLPYFNKRFNKNYLKNNICTISETWGYEGTGRCQRTIGFMEQHKLQANVALSIGYKIAMMLEGQARLSFHYSRDIKPWDMAAPQAVLEGIPGAMCEAMPYEHVHPQRFTYANTTLDCMPKINGYIASLPAYQDEVVCGLTHPRSLWRDYNQSYVGDLFSVMGVYDA